MAFTVSAAITNAGNGQAIKVFVVTGAAEAGGASAGMDAYAAANAALTPARTGSLVLFGLMSDAGTFAAQTAEPSNTLTDNAAAGTAGAGYADGHYTGTVTSGTPVTVGASAPSAWNSLAAYELIPSSGTVTPLIDASTPASAQATGSPVTSPSFSPPPGAVLAVAVMWTQTATSAVTVTDTSGQGLTWTQRAFFQNAAYEGGAALYTATVPGFVYNPAGFVNPLPPTPNWFPGADSLVCDPASVPFAIQPYFDPSLYLAATPPVAGSYSAPSPFTPGPGWFPGADGLVNSPGDIPFSGDPQPGWSVPIPPVPNTGWQGGAGEFYPQNLIPPGWFPGSDAAAAAPGGIPFYGQPSAAVYQAAYPPYIAGLSGATGPGYWVDQNNRPRLWVAAETWGLPTNAGAWNGSGGGTWQQDYDNFFAHRAAQGVTVLLTDPVGNTIDGNPSYDNGNTWDNVAPFVTGQDPTSGLNGAFWQRIDYMLASALHQGVTVGLVLNTGYDTGTGECYNGWTSAQYQAYGTALGSRYKAQPNLIWVFGNDTYPTGFDTSFSYFRTGLAAAGDAHLAIAWWEAEYTSRYEADNNLNSAWGTSNSAVNFCYSYNAGYWIIDYAYSETASPDSQAHLLPVIWGDGYFYQGGSTYSSTYDRAMRQETWWTLASGARGFLTEAENVYPWGSTSLAAVNSNWFFANNLGNIVTYFTSLPGWYNLLPDLSSAFVTAGRGTRVTGYAAGGGGGQYEPAFTNSYVTASVTPDGTLAVCYLPNHTTITVNTALLATGWTATWVDPVTCATSSAGAGPTFSSTAKGTSSQGDPDWVLVFQAAGSTNATATPAAVTGTAAVAAPAVSTGETVSPAAAAATSSVPSVTVATGETAAPPAVAATSSVPAAAIATGETVTAPAVAAASSVPAVTAAGGANPAPAAVTATAGVPAVTIMPGPAAASAAAAVAGPAVSAGETAGPAALTASSSVPAVTVTVPARPAAVAAASSVPAVSVSTGETAGPATVTATSAVTAAAASGNAAASPAALAVTAAVPAVTIMPGPSAVTAVASVAAPAVSDGETAVPAPVSASASVPAPVVMTAALPAVIAASASVPAPAIAAGETASPAAVTSGTAVTAAAASGNAYITPAALAVSATVTAATAAGGANPVPSAVAASAGVPAVTVATGETVTPAPVAAAVSFPAASVSPAPAAVTAAAAFPAATASGGAGISPAAVAGTASVPGVSVATGQTASPAAVTATAAAAVPVVTVAALPAAVASAAAIPAPAVATGGTASPGAATAASAVASAAASGSAYITPAAVTGTAAFTAPSVVPGPAAVQATAAVATPMVSAGGNATVVASVVTAAASIAVPVVRQDRNVTPAAVAASWAAGSAAVSTGETVTAASVTATGAVPAPSPSAGQTAAPAAVSASAAVNAASASGSAYTSQGVLTATAAVTAATASGNAAPSPAVLASASSVPAPAVSTGETVTPAVLAASASVPVPAVSASGNAAVTPAAVTASAAVPAPTVRQDQAITAAAVTSSAVVAAVTVTCGTTASPAPLTASASVPAPAVATGTSLTVTPVAATASVPGPQASGGASVVLSALAVSVTIPAPSVSTATGATVAAVTVTAVFTAPQPQVRQDQDVAPAAVLVTATFGVPVVSAVTGYTGTVLWSASPAPPRWAAQAAAPRWHVSPATLRWKATLMNFAPIAAISLEEINVLWTSALAGTEIDPTGATEGQPALTVQFAFPQSSGNPLEPAEPQTWFAGSWLTGTNIAGYVAQALVGPGGGVVTLTAGLQYDAWTEILGAPECPRKFAGTIAAY